MDTRKKVDINLQRLMTNQRVSNFKKDISILKVIAVLVLCFIWSISKVYAKDDVKINILAANPSETDRMNAEIQHYLPPEIKPEDVIEKAGLELKFDQERSAYFLSGQVALEPNEAKTIGVVVRNVWVVPEEDIEAKRKEIEDSIKALEGTEYYETARLLNEKVAEKLSALEEDRNKAVGMRQRIELYRSQVKQLDSISRNIASLDTMRELKTNSEVRTVKMLITAENPTENPQTMTIRSALPKEITAEDVIDKLDFLLLYDATEKLFVLEKKDTLQPLESKRYEIILRDIWYIPQERIELLKKQTESVLTHLKGSSYEKFATQQGESIYKILDEIISLQAEVADSTVLEDRMRAFILNSSRYDLAAQKLRDLQALLLEVPMKRTETAIEQIRKAVKSIRNVVDVIRVGFQPNLSTTWLIILGIIAFLFVMAASFYVVWVSKLKDLKSIKKKDSAKKTSPESK